MAFSLKGTSLSHFRLQPQKGDSFTGSSVLMRRGLHVEPGAREKALLAEDPALKHFKSHKKSVSRLKRVGDALTIIVVAESLVIFDRNGHVNGCHEVELSKYIDRTWKFAHYKSNETRFKDPHQLLGLVYRNHFSPDYFFCHAKGCCYEIYVKAVMREEAREQARESA